jgi:hypothetical protein
MEKMSKWSTMVFKELPSQVLYSGFHSISNGFKQGLFQPKQRAAFQSFNEVDKRLNEIYLP